MNYHIDDDDDDDDDNDDDDLFDMMSSNESRPEGLTHSFLW